MRADKGRPAPNLLAFYGLQQQAFDVTPDPAYLFPSPLHREALSALSLGIENLRGFLALIAEPGMGKTTLLNKLIEELRDSARVVFLFQTQCSSEELLRYLLSELEVEYEGMDIVAMHRALSQASFEEMLQGRRFVLIVDEAQNLDDSVLEAIRLLSDYETTHSKLIQIVLAGQPQLVKTLMQPNLAQLRQRIAVLANLQPLNVTETAEYIEHRLRTAGRDEGNPLFTPNALVLIAESSGGVPRTINNICFSAMLAGYMQRKEVIDAEIVKKAASQWIWSCSSGVLSRKCLTSRLAAPDDLTDHIQLAHPLTPPLHGSAHPIPNTEAAKSPPSKARVALTGKLIQKVSHSWSKKPESRIDVSFERDSASSVTVADRHYCSSFYLNEDQASVLQVGKPIRIEIEQE